jgi:hypothetical protein
MGASQHLFSCHKKHLRGFTLVEMVLSTAIFVTAFGGLTIMMANMVGFARDSVASRESVNIHRIMVSLIKDIELADTIIVLGGVDELGNNSTSAYAAANPTIANINAGLANVAPNQITSPTQFRTLIGAIATIPAQDVAETNNAYNARLSVSTRDYSVYFVKGRTVASSLNVVVTAANWTFTVTYRAYSYAEDGTMTISLEDIYTYSMQTATDFADLMENLQTRPSARHYWLRQASTWGISEHIGTRIILPDPLANPIYVGTNATDNAKTDRTFSRYTLFLPTKP